MNLALFIENGPLQGQSFPLKSGFIVGRSKGDLAIRDRKASTEHCRIDYLDNQWILVDLGSSNGTWHNNARQTSLNLSIGTRFRIGTTEIRVVESKASREVTWLDEIKQEVRALELSRKTPKDSSDAGTSITGFRPYLVMLFRQGPHAGQKMLLGYGPRRIGGEVLDIELMDIDIPAIAFEVRPHGEKAEFFTPVPELVTLNGQQIAKASINPGDLVQVGKTVIEFEYTLDPKDYTS